MGKRPHVNTGCGKTVIYGLQIYLGFGPAEVRLQADLKAIAWAVRDLG